MNIRHDTPMSLEVYAGTRLLEASVVRADHLNGAITRASYTYNLDPYSGGALWGDPVTGERFKTRPMARYTVLDDSYILDEGEECPCDVCMGTS